MKKENRFTLLPLENTKYYMETQKNMGVNTMKNNKMEYKNQPITVKITPEIESMLQYISSETTLNTSSIVRYGISELYKKVKTDEMMKNGEIHNGN